jgi:hypothetical protein
MPQGVLPYRADWNLDPIMFPHFARGICKGAIRSKISQHPLQPAGVTTVLDSSTLTKGTQT